MNSNFSVEQIKAYAAAFEAGDAVFVNGGWEKVVKEYDYHLDDCALAGGRCVYAIKRIGEYDEKAITKGFLKEAVVEASEQYRVTTLVNYELQGGEKLVWLGDDDDNRVMFGKVYDTFIDSAGDVVYTDEEYMNLIPEFEDWAVIPKYNQVKTVERSGDETKDIARVLYKRYYDVLQSALHNNIKSALQENNYSLVIELSELAIEMEESK